MNSKDGDLRPSAKLPASPYYAPLEWNPDSDYLDADDGLAADGEDWRYTIEPIRDEDGHIVGYRVHGGDIDSGDELGSLKIDGQSGELTLEAAMAAANENYLDRYLEAETFLDDLLDGWEDEDGVLVRRNERGRLVCRVAEPGVEEVEVVATLRDYGEEYDADSRSVALCLRTILSFSNNGDREALVDDLRRIIRLETQRRSS